MYKKYLQGIIFAGLGFTFATTDAISSFCDEDYRDCKDDCGEEDYSCHWECAMEKRECDESLRRK